MSAGFQTGAFQSNAFQQGGPAPIVLPTGPFAYLYQLFVPVRIRSLIGILSRTP